MPIIQFKAPVKSAESSVPAEMPDFSSLSAGARMVAEIQWRKDNPPPPLLSTEGLIVLDHDPVHPHWQRPIVWSGAGEVKVRAVAAELCFERIPFALEELVVFSAYAKWLYKEQARLDFYPAHARAGMLEASIHVAYQYLKPWAPGIEAYLRGNTDELTRLHKADQIYPRLLEAAGPEEIKEAMAKMLSLADAKQLEPDEAQAVIEAANSQPHLVRVK